VRQEWLRHSDTETQWACFCIFDNHADVLAPSERIHTTMTLAAARTLWLSLVQQGWHRATEQEIDAQQMSYARLLTIGYQRRR
jgi:hypothetical protein